MYIFHFKHTHTYTNNIFKTAHTKMSLVEEGGGCGGRRLWREEAVEGGGCGGRRLMPQ